MKEIDLNSYGVTAMNAKEMKEIDGGCLVWILIAAGCYAIGYWLGGEESGGGN